MLLPLIMTISFPTRSQCLALIDRYNMLDNIRDHSFKVARVAELLITGLHGGKKTTAPQPEIDLVIAGSLLHDIAKTQCLEGKCFHDVVGQEICNDLGYPEIGEIVREHVLLKSFTPQLYQKGIWGAKEIVYYADKRVRHDEIVSLESRLEYIINIYGDNSPEKEYYIRHNFQQCQELEGYIFAFLDFAPDEIQHLISEEAFS